MLNELLKDRGILIQNDEEKVGEYPNYIFRIIYKP